MRARISDHLPTLAAAAAGLVGALLGAGSDAAAELLAAAEEAAAAAAAAVAGLAGGTLGKLVERSTWAASSHRDAVAGALAADARHVESIDEGVWQRLGVDGARDALERLGLDPLVDAADHAGELPPRDPDTGRFLPHDDDEGR